MKTYVQPGDIMTFTAPSGGVVSGTAYLIGSLLVIATATVAETLPFEGLVKGVVSHAKTSAQAWTEGQKIYFNGSTSKFDSDSTTGPLVGVAAVAAANPSSTGYVRLNGVPADTGEGAQTAIADLTLGTDITAATANGSLEDSAAVNPTKVNFDNNMKEIGAKINAMLAVMRTRGDIAP